jgi:hypothetical protein
MRFERGLVSGLVGLSGVITCGGFYVLVDLGHGVVGESMITASIPAICAKTASILVIPALSSNKSGRILVLFSLSYMT